MHDLSGIYHTKNNFTFFVSYNGYNLLCSNTTLLKGLSFDRSYRSYSAERKPEIQSYIVKLIFKTSAILVHSSIC